MNDIEWPEEAPQKKRGIPKWVLFGCGGGCLLALIVGAIIGFFAFRFVKDMQDPAKVWPLVEEALPFDEQPVDWGVIGGGAWGAYQIIMIPPGGGPAATLHSYSEGMQLDELFDPDSFANNMPMMSLEDTESGTIEIQGRTVRCMRFVGPEPVNLDKLPSIRVDLTGDGTRNVCFQISVRGEEPVPDEALQGMLEPFNVWKGK